MKIALLGYGKEGKATEQYFKKHYDNLECDIFENFNYNEIRQRDYSSYDIIFRSPSVPPLRLPNESSVTRYFFDHCPCPIIGVTGTKGKGTTCSMISTILTAIDQRNFLVGNIGTPALDVLDALTKTDVVIYEMSSFQLWDLKKSPHVAVVLRIEPDHLNVHRDFADYVDAKSRIATYQTSKDSLIFFQNNPHSIAIAEKSPAHKFSYPAPLSSDFTALLGSLQIPGDHNKENAEAALRTVACYKNISPDELISKHFNALKSALSHFKSLPHHLEFVRTLNGVDYYDDSFSASYPSLDVALKAFPSHRIVLIAGGKDRNLDLTPTKRAIFDNQNLQKALLIGETKHTLAKGEDASKYALFDDLISAVRAAKDIAEKTPNSIVLLSPGAASFDMFKNFYDRGDKFKQIVKELT